jgi:hypothetical protein
MLLTLSFPIYEMGITKSLHHRVFIRIQGLNVHSFWHHFSSTCIPSLSANPVTQPIKIPQTFSSSLTYQRAHQHYLKPEIGQEYPISVFPPYFSYDPLSLSGQLNPMMEM